MLNHERDLISLPYIAKTTALWTASRLRGFARPARRHTVFIRASQIKWMPSYGPFDRIWQSPGLSRRREDTKKRQIAGKNLPTGFMCDSIYRFAWQPPGNAQPRTRLDTPSAHRKNRLHFVPLRAFAASREQRRDQLDGIRCS